MKKQSKLFPVALLASLLSAVAFQTQVRAQMLDDSEKEAVEEMISDTLPPDEEMMKEGEEAAEEIKKGADEALPETVPGAEY